MIIIRLVRSFEDLICLPSSFEVRIRWMRPALVIAHLKALLNIFLSRFLPNTAGPRHSPCICCGVPRSAPADLELHTIPTTALTIQVNR